LGELKKSRVREEENDEEDRVIKGGRIHEWLRCEMI